MRSHAHRVGEGERRRAACSASVSDAASAGVSASPPLTDTMVSLSGDMFVETPAGRHVFNRLGGQFVTPGYFEAMKTALVEKPDSLEALAAADEYYLKALDLWPDNTEALQQRNMAHLFIQAQTDFSKGRYDDVIEMLEKVFTEDPGYAAGTARQTLFEAYVARGDDRMLSGDYEPALEDFQRAAVLAEQGENARIRLFQAQIRIAEAMGSLLQYEDAVLLYRTAIDNAQLSDADLKQRPELVSKLNQADGYVRTMVKARDGPSPYPPARPQGWPLVDWRSHIG